MIKIIKYLTLSAFCVAGSICLADLHNPFDALPASTFGAARLDVSSESHEEWRRETELGQLIFSDEKIESYKAMVEELADTSDNFGQFVEEMESVGLSLEDLYSLMESKIGFAVADIETEVGDKMPTIYFWAETEDGMAEKIFTSIVEEAADSEGTIREDQEIAGVPMSRIRDADTGSSFLVAQMANRFMFVIGMPRETADLMNHGDKYEAAEESALGYFIQGQKEGEGGFREAFYGDEGIQNALPEGEQFLEIVGNIGSLIDLLPADEGMKLAPFGLDQFTKIGLWASMDGEGERTKFFVGAPEPRRGITRLLELEPMEFQPPAWVPAEISSYSVVGFSFEKFYEVAYEIAGGFLPQQMIDEQIESANSQLGMMLQTDIESIVKAFGNRVHMIEYPMLTQTMDLGEGQSLEIPTESVAVVMDFDQPQLLDNAMAMFGGLMAQPGGGIGLLDELGYKGMRMDAAMTGQDITFAYGGGKMIVSVGAGTDSKIFSAMNNPPEGEDALINDPKFRAFMEKYSPKQGTGFSYADGSKALQGLGNIFTQSLELLFASEEGFPSELFDRFIELMPSEEELSATLGVIYSRSYHDEHGYVAETLNEFN
ncbi:MAG: hypothetical protein AAGB46_01765 [Verrucomicrobiota bacterium]